MPTVNEARTRTDLIDPALARAGWDVHNPHQVGIEIPADGFDPNAWAQLKVQLDAIRAAGDIPDVETPSGVCDYVLYRENGDIMAVVEAKKTVIDPRLAEAQAEFYVSEIAKHQSFQPFAFLTNGLEIYYLDAGVAPKRLVAGFFSRSDLENLLWMRENKKPLSETPINTVITDRIYQQEAIRRVCEAFEQNKRRALLVMATGTGKTRTVISLADVFLRANQARRLLFVADRDPLVEQALRDGFKKFLPNEPSTRIHTQTFDTNDRLYVSTLQTLNLNYRRFTPGFFDLIIFDEVHRSIFNKWSEVLEYFDARMIGLTATPATFIDRNTFLAFGCADGIPTFLYPFDRAVKEGYLVDFSLYRARTHFQRSGIKGVDLTEEERNTLLEQGLDPDEISFEGTDLERKVSDRDMLRKQCQEILDQAINDRSGQQIGKTIIFAITQDHALRIADVFDEICPQFPGLVRVITYKSDFKGKLIDDFKDQDLPRIAITVDLLETGIDVPEVVNLVFMKPVHSYIKLWQMIGRGTRSDAACRFHDRLPNGKKTEFQIIDFWENDFERAAEEEVAYNMPVLCTVFNTRLKLLEYYLALPQSPERDAVVASLRRQVAELPLDSFAIKRVLPDVEQTREDQFWSYINTRKVNFLRNTIAPLLRYVPGVDIAAMTFTSKVERLKLQILTDKDSTATVESIRDDASRMPPFVLEDPALLPLVEFCLAPSLESATPSQLDGVIRGLAPEMKNRREQPNSFLALDLPDYIEMRGFILLKGGTERVYVEEYRKRIEEHILNLVATHPTIAALDRGEELSDDQLIELERSLRNLVGGGDLELSEGNIRKAYGWKVDSLLEFLRNLLDLPNLRDYDNIVRDQFQQYIARNAFNADQTRFLDAVMSVFLQRRRLSLVNLYESPLDQFGADAVERLFTPAQIERLLAFANTIAA